MSHKYIYAIAAAALLLLTMIAINSAYGQSGPLDGKTLIADSGPKGMPADEKGDVITFANGMFHSAMCDQYGYGKGAYTATREGEKWVVKVDTFSEKDGKLSWNLSVKGDEVDGTLMRQKKGWFFNPNPAPVEYWVKGKVKS